MIPYGKQDISNEDIQAVVDVLKSDFLTQGPAVPAFEKKLADYCQAKYAVAVNSATSALHIACLALGLGENDLLWTSPITFVASANCALYCGASVDFVDIDPETYNMSASLLEEKLIKAKQEKKLPKIVIPVHLSGQSCEMSKFHELSQEYGFKIIEDASHAIGARYKNEPVGNCKYSDITVFSFHPVKIITSAEGGMATSNSPELIEKMNLYRSHGVTRDPQLLKKHSDGAWYYQQIDLGYNYRMTELQAALGLSQLTRLDEFVTSRQNLFNLYNEKLKNLPIILPKQNSDTYSSLHLYIIQIDLDKTQKSHKELFDNMRALGIGVNLHYIPVHTQPYYQERFSFSNGDFPNSEKYYSQAISIPLYHSMTIEELETVVKALEKILS